MAYSKLHSSIVNSSLWTEPDSVRILFITLLAMCDRDGVVYGTRIGLNRLANIDPDGADEAWASLLSKDANSSDKMRAPENEGRRVEEVPGGFRLLNFEYYRGLRNDDDRRDQNRVAQAKFKAKSAKVSPGKPASAGQSHANPISEAEAEPLRGRRNGKSRPLSVLDLKDIKASKLELAEELKRVHSNDVAGGVEWTNLEKKAEYRKLKAEAKEVTKQIANRV